MHVKTYMSTSCYNLLTGMFIYDSYGDQIQKYLEQV